MDEQVNTTNWLPVGEAALKAPGGRMTTSNMRYLLKNRRIRGVLVGGRWLVDPESLAKYVPTRPARKRVGERSTW